MRHNSMLAQGYVLFYPQVQRQGRKSKVLSSGTQVHPWNHLLKCQVHLRREGSTLTPLPGEHTGALQSEQTRVLGQTQPDNGASSKENTVSIAGSQGRLWDKRARQGEPRGKVGTLEGDAESRRPRLPQTNHTHHSEASQGPLPLDKPDHLSLTFLQGTTGESAAWNAQDQAPGLPSPSLEPQSPAWPHHDAGATQGPLRLPGSNLGNAWRRESDLLSLRQSSLGTCRDSDTSLLDSGYAGDEENSEVSLVARRHIVRLHRSLNTQTDSAQSSQLCAIYSPSQIRRQPGTQSRPGWRGRATPACPAAAAAAGPAA
ncbi:protein TNT [Neofelis nebulosa]|uniref:protein TNT n=1 Tax=Neofelis nebulosa TaxID=61452 RepID=UPI00272A2CBF|nr:protein TNT [Neofelis nebulosa]